MTKQLFIFFTALSLSATAQQPGQIVGKWNLIALYDSDVYYHVGKDSVSILRSHAGLSTTGLDSIKSMLLPTIEALKTLYFTFNNDYTYETFVEATGKEGGTFKLGETVGTIELRSKAVNEKYHYTIEQDVLELKPVGESESVVLIMERESKRAKS